MALEANKAIIPGDLFNGKGGSTTPSGVKSNITWPYSGSYLYSCRGQVFDTEEYGKVYYISFAHWISGATSGQQYYAKITGPGDFGTQYILGVISTSAIFLANNVWIPEGSTVTFEVGYPM